VSSESEAAVVFIPGGVGEIVGDSPERRVEILSDDDALNATWSRFGPGREGADLHVHYKHTDLFYVLDGNFTLRLGIEDEQVVAPAGTLVRIPPEVVHGFRNASKAEVRFLNFHAPGREFAEYMRAMRDGRQFSYDQHPPPESGWRSPSDAKIGGNDFTFEQAGLKVALLADVDEIAISETRTHAGIPGPPRHLHQRHVESFYVVEGALKFEAGGHELLAEAGSWVQVPPGVPHTFSASAAGSARFIDVHTPGSGFGAFLRGLLEDRLDPERAADQAGFDQVAAPEM
jgi:mannose-6-phosphate isomerase-like protein (cupin superfamily)